MKAAAARSLSLCWGLGLAAIAAASAGCEREVVFPPGTEWGAPPQPDYIGKARIGLTNNGDDTLAFLTLDSLDQPRILGKAIVGNNPIELEGPHHLVATADGRHIYFNLSNYVLNGGSGPHGAHGTGMVPGYLVKLDARTNRAVGQVLIDRSPGDVILSADEKLIFVSHYDLARLSSQLVRGAPREEGYSKIAIIDAETLELLAMKPVCPTAHGQGLSPDGKRLYVTCSLSDELAVVEISDPRQPQVIATVPVGPTPGSNGAPNYAPYALSVHPNGSVWISNNKSGDVRVFDPVTMKMDATKTVTVGGVAMFGDFRSEAGKLTLYVPHQGDDRVTAIDTVSLAKQDLSLSKAACLNAHAIRVLPDGKSAVLVCEGDHRVVPGTAVFLDLSGPTMTARGYVEVGLFPDGIALLPPL